MANPHQLSQYEKTCNSPGRSQHKGTGSDDFDRGYNCGYNVNHLFWG